MIEYANLGSKLTRFMPTVELLLSLLAVGGENESKRKWLNWEK
jgi:hypothetical protein